MCSNRILIKNKTKKQTNKKIGKTETSHVTLFIQKRFYAFSSIPKQGCSNHTSQRGVLTWKIILCEGEDSHSQLRYRQQEFREGAIISLKDLKRLTDKAMPNTKLSTPLALPSYPSI